MTETKTAAPRRSTATRTRATANKKAAPVAAAKKLAAVPTEATEAPAVPAGAKGTAVAYSPDPRGDSTNYSRWVPEEGTGFTGVLYAPLGTKSVTVYVQ